MSQGKESKMQHGPRGMSGGSKSKTPIKTLNRLMSYVFSKYKIQFIIVVICIIISSLVNVLGTLFLKNLIDDYITPFIGQKNPDFMPLIKAISYMAAIYLIGVVTTYAYNRIMIIVAAGSLKKIRDDMFTHMEKLSIPFFDTHPHGELMSLYTNDIDTLRQMLSQSIPQLISSAITIAGVLVSMLVLSIPLTLITILMVVVMTQVVKVIGGKSGIYFGKQQKDLGKLNGYIEEMMEGQKVIKIFNHEEESKKKFDELNENLCDSADKANTFANILMPIMGN